MGLELGGCGGVEEKVVEGGEEEEEEEVEDCIILSVITVKLIASSWNQQDAKIEPEEFTSRLQTELKSSPQPYLVPFLKVCPVTLTPLSLYFIPLRSNKWGVWVVGQVLHWLDAQSTVLHLNSDNNEVNLNYSE